jgi:hypothetical protein
VRYRNPGSCEKPCGPLGSGAPNPTTKPLSMRAPSESRLAAYSAGAMPWADTATSGIRKSRQEMVSSRIMISARARAALVGVFAESIRD